VTSKTLELARLAAAGDQKALDTLLEQSLPTVRAFVRAHMGAKLRARESASDVVQSVCRELLTRKDRFQHPSEQAFQAWLLTTARRKVNNRARDLEREKRSPGREAGTLDEDALGELGAAYARVTSPGDRVLRAEEVARLEAAIDQLPEEQREVITLAHLAGLSRGEIAQQMGKTEEAVRAMLHRAKARLALLLDGPA
jgi:RNA polymerase sigma-70 factor (ECF subfamily)